MKVIDLHPEDLLDKDGRGELTDDERARLDAHLARCATCRFERQARADFREEIDDEIVLSSRRLLALVEGMPPRADVAPPNERTESVEHVPTASKMPSSRPASIRRRTRVVLLVAAALFVGGVATAGAGARVWARVVSTFSSTDSTLEPSSPAVTQPAPPTHAAAPSKWKADPVAVPAPSTEPTLAATPPEMPEPNAPVAKPAASMTERAAPSLVRDVGSVSYAFAEPVETPASMFDTANEARRKGDYARAIFLHRRLQVSFPTSREAHVSCGSLGRLLLDRGDAAAALASFDSYQARGRGPLDEAVLVGRATALERLGRVDDARTAWTALLSAFPDTPYAEHARTRAAGASPRP